MSIVDAHLETRLAPYPHLRQALGEAWIARENPIDPVLSQYRLARWLRLEGFEADLGTLEGILAKFRDTSGMQERRQRIRSDPSALMETLTELYFGAWLMEEGFAFIWPKSGSDFLVSITGDFDLSIEVTTPRISSWAQDLFERLDFLSRQKNLRVELRFDSERLPFGDQEYADVQQILTDQISLLDSLESDSSEQSSRSVNPQVYPELGLTITCIKDTTSGASAVFDSKTSTPYRMLHLIYSAAMKKAYQLPESQPGILLIGTEQLPISEWWQFDDAIHGYSHYELPFDWNTLPNQIKYVVFYTLEMKRVEPFSVVWLSNLASSFPDSEGALEFLNRLGPNPLSSSVTQEPM